MDKPDTAAAARTVRVVTVRHVYHTPGQPAHPLGKAIDLPVEEAERFIALGHVRLPTDDPRTLPGTGPLLDERGVMRSAIPPPPAPHRHSPAVLERARQNPQTGLGIL